MLKKDNLKFKFMSLVLFLLLIIRDRTALTENLDYALIVLIVSIIITIMIIHDYCKGYISENVIIEKIILIIAILSEIVIAIHYFTKFVI